MVMFTWSPLRFAVGIAGWGSLGAVAGQLLLVGIFAVVTGHPIALPSVAAPFIAAQVAGMWGGGAIIAMTCRRPPWVCIDNDGIAFGGRGDHMFIPWAAVSTIQIRGRWYFTQLHLTPTDARLATWRSRRTVAGAIRELRDAHGALTYVIDIGVIRGGPRPLGTLLLNSLQRRQLTPSRSTVAR